MILLKTVKNLSAYGVPELKGSRIVRIVEKPKIAPSPYAVIGIYFYDNEVFRIIKTLRPSGRGELEITDVNNSYIRRKQMRYGILSGHWADAGESIESWFQANLLMQQAKKQKTC
jgi:glucose-1-phosphate thymidylyltransferase